MSSPSLWPNLTKTIHHTEYEAISPLNPANSHTGKTVVVTGGATGMGLLIARAFLRANARTVVLLSRRETVLADAAAELRKEFGGTESPTHGNDAKVDKVLTYAVDITDGDRVDDVFADVRRRINTSTTCTNESPTPRDIDILVLSAAHVEFDLATLGYGQRAQHASFATNITGNLNAIRAFVPAAATIPLADLHAGKMLEPLRPTTTVNTTTTTTSSSPPDRVILNIADVIAYTPFPTQSLYGASKLAFAHLLRHLDTELAHLPFEPTTTTPSNGSSSSALRPVRAHNLHPGAVLTPAGRAVGYDETTFAWDDESLPGAFAAWLATDAGRFLRGRFVHANWDVGEMERMRGRFAEDGDLGAVVLKV